MWERIVLYYFVGSCSVMDCNEVILKDWSFEELYFDISIFFSYFLIPPYYVLVANIVLLLPLYSLDNFSY